MRLHLTLALLTAILLAVTLYYTKKARHTFGYVQVQQLAEKLAQEKYKPPQDILPPQLKKLTPEQERGIFWKDTARLWRAKGYPFQVDFYHQLKSNPLPHSALSISYVDHKGAHPVPYSPLFFNYHNLSFDPPLPADLGYAGFYLRYPINKPESLDGFFSVMGSNYFRVIAKDQVYGLSARALAINTHVEKKAEEFPDWKGWWLHEPSTTSTEIVLDALMDSPSVTGEYEFKIQPGAVTTVHVHATLFFRQAVEQIGIAPFSSMYLFGENAKDHFGDNVHPEIHDSDGVLMQRNSGEWVWRPLEQAQMLQIYAFPDENPRGFGLIQRDRDFNHYQDLNNKYNVRPSAWVTPQGNWDKGAFMLTQLPTNNTDTDNVVLFWAPEKEPKAGERMELNYTIDFYMNDAERPPLAYTRETLINCPAPAPAPASLPPPPAPTGKPAPPAPPPPPPAPPKPGDTVPVQFVIDFVGHGIEDIPAEQPPDLDLIALPPGTVIRERKVEKNSYDHSWKVTFTVIPLKHNVPTELICRLNSRGKPLTETWTYTWHQ